MSATGLFTIGVLVTLIVAAAMALLIYAAILDGRDVPGGRVEAHEIRWLLDEAALTGAGAS